MFQQRLGDDPTSYQGAEPPEYNFVQHTPLSMRNVLSLAGPDHEQALFSPQPHPFRQGGG